MTIQLKIRIVLIVLFISGSVHAQDLIVTKKNDSIRCHITKMEKGVIYYSYLKNGKLRNAKISKDETTSYQESYFKEKEKPKKHLPPGTPSPWRIVFKGGYSWMTARVNGHITSYLSDYAKDFKHGFHIGTEADYFFNDHIGLGGKFTFYKNRNEADIAGYGRLRDNATCFYLAPTFITRFRDRSDRNTILIDASIGYFSYRDNGSAGWQSGILEGKTCGFQVGLGYERRVSESFSIGGEFSFLLASKRWLKYKSGGSSSMIRLDERENLSRIDVSLFVAFRPGRKR